MTIKCPAKINLSLDVIGKREDGYHLLRMIMQTVSLFDNVTVQKGSEGINIYCNKSSVPCNENNSAYKAAKLILDKFQIKSGVDILIDKEIPVAAGLAGGSTDAAGVIKAMNEIFKLHMTMEDMMEIGLKVGADVPYCIIGGTALAEGIGEKLTVLKQFKETWCVLAKPPISVSTADVYGSLKLDEIVRHPDTEELIDNIEKEEIDILAKGMVNVLETVTIKEYPIILEIKNIMKEFNALGSLMSGSGPTVFGLFRDKAEAEKCYHRLRDYLKEVYLVKTL
ncbi:4-diphosphocytidyl-2C-methyl-D-erythritol kinase [Fervidicella metallireducens AeB]|uniref:4-diphosphocytidyl-2-C-methyl-D-erythritol kinase n=1 Tax=Fervidicella metallireducens AeB TaxID=1403537 RepID=A0A017S0S5_9CLOT|nr:4-(cytidine 5'-diphospho)-2-C-methyl-D-erythritol kinase [Fervidicella metallireducens]EYE89785.1 4-diphosphocytidyl-2C-methyl-D-erythritol kinase [Fervidicella metallireducens AeB]